MVASTVAIALVLAGGLSAQPAPGDRVSASTLLLESHTAPVGQEAAGWIEGVARGLGRPSLRGPALATRLRREYGRPARPFPAKALGALQADLRAGLDAYHEGSFSRAAELLGRVERRLAGCVYSVGRSPQLLADLSLARLRLAEIHHREGRLRAARAILGRLLRSDPEPKVSEGQHGPLATRLVYEARREAETRATGTLQVHTSPPGASVILSGRFVGLSPVTLERLVPGVYEVLALDQRGRPGRVHRVKVRGRTSLRLELAVERILHLGDQASSETSPVEAPVAGRAPGVGLRLPEGPGRAGRELAAALSVGRRLGASRVVLVGLREAGGRRALVGRLIGVAEGRVLRTAYLAMDRGRPTTDRLARLGSLLAGRGRPGAGVVLEDVHAGRRFEARRRSLLISGLVLLSVGVAAAAAGGALLGIDGQLKPGQLTEVYDTKREGAAVLGAGAAAIVTGSVLLVTRAALRRPPPRWVEHLQVGPTRGGLLITAAGRF